MATTAVATTKGALPTKGKAAGRQQQQSRLVAVPKPNDEEFRKRELAETTKITELQTALTKLQEQIRSKQGGREEYNHKRAEIRHRLDDINQNINRLQEEFTQLLSKINEQQQQSRLKRNEVLNLKKGLQYETEEQIDEQIRELEHYMITTSVSLRDEKDLVSKMQQLHKMKPKVRDYSQRESDARASDSTTVPLKDRLEQIRSELNKLRDRKREESSRNEQLVEERQKSTAPVKDLVDQRNELHNKLTEHKKTLMEIRAEKSAAQQQYSAYLQQLRKARKDAEREEKRKYDLQMRKQKIERDLESLEMADDNLPGMQLLQQTVIYTQKLVDEHKKGSDGVTDNTQAAASGASPSSAPTPQLDGEFAKVMVPKSQREEEFYFAPSKKKGRKTRKGASQKKTGVISHDFHTLLEFKELEVTPPLTYAEAEDVLAKLKEKLDALEGRRSEFEESNRRKKEQLHAELAALEKEERVQQKAEQESDEAAAAAAAAAEGGSPQKEDE